MGRLRHEAGQTVVLFALLLPLLFGLGAIAVDIGYWYVVQKTAQDAADAAALAAARELDDCAAAGAVGHDYGQRNMPDATVEVLCGAAGIGSGKVEVAVTAKADTFFGRLFGVLDVTITQRAVAERINSPGNLAIFSHSLDCADGLEFDAERVSINGHIHSNGQFRISRGPFWAASGTNSEVNCSPSVELDIDSQFGNGSPPDTGPAPIFATLQWPVWYTPADFGWVSSCTFKGTTIEVTAQEVVVRGPDQVVAHNGTLPTGTYCATESFALTGDGVRGAITALAPSITVDASDTELRAYSGTRVLFFAIPNNDVSPTNDGSLSGGGNPTCQPDPAADLTLNGEGQRWRGVVFSPCGRVVVNIRGAQALVGAIVARQVRVDADGFDMIGESDFEVQTALVE